MKKACPFTEHKNQLEAQKRERERVFEVCNANLRAAFNCPLKHRSPTVDMCLICANKACVDAWQEQNRLWRLSNDASLREMRELEKQKPRAIAFEIQAKKAIQAPSKNLFTITKEEAA